MKTFVIHYDKLVGRKINMLKQLEENGMDAEFISNRGKDVLTETDKHPFSKLNDSEISLFLHHYECFKKIIENQADFALILEDDVILCDNFIEKLNNYITQLPENIDMLFIGDGCNLHIEKHKLIPNKNIYEKCLYPTSWGGNGASRCSDSYIITKKCANKMCEYINNLKYEITLPIDWWLNVATRDNNFKVYWAEPTIVTQGTQNGTFQSSI